MIVCKNAFGLFLAGITVFAFTYCPGFGSAQSSIANFYLTTMERNVSVNKNMEALDPQFPFKFIIHGWTENANRSLYVNMAHAYLKRGNYNVIRVDYSPISGLNYLEACFSINKVGFMLGTFISELRERYGVSPRNVHLVGHSLGGQVSGFAARHVLNRTGMKIGRITALDPARPLFENIRADDAKLNREDAMMVDIVHTDAGELGYLDPRGRIDFYPNSGERLQPGCKPSMNPLLTVLSLVNGPWNNRLHLSDDFCSHQRSLELFLESINMEISATRCDSWKNFEDGKCENNEKIIFGEHAPAKTEGKFYFYTSETTPYLNI